MAILVFPTLARAPSQVSWQLRARTQRHESPFDGTTQTLAMPGAYWMATLSWASIEGADRRNLEGFLASLMGAAGRFTIGPFHASRRAQGTGTPVLASGGQSGSTLSVGGWTGNADAARVGDFLSYADTTGRQRLHIVTSSRSADGTGLASIPIAPPIRRPGNALTPVNFITPTGVFRLASDDEGAVDTRPPLLASVTLNIVEALA